MFSQAGLKVRYFRSIRSGLTLPNCPIRC